MCVTFITVQQVPRDLGHRVGHYILVCFFQSVFNNLFSQKFYFTIIFYPKVIFTPFFQKAIFNIYI